MIDPIIFLYTWFRGELIGTDEYENRYFEEKKARKNCKKRRWVLYKGPPEASKVPAIWHAWLHYTVENIQPAKKNYTWEKPHLPNLTGTALAYKPQGLVDGAESYSKDYQSWDPN